jgi:hypothetical protein
MKVRHPWLALCIYLGIGYLAYRYGLRDAALYVFLIIGGIFFYRLLTFRQT